MQVLGIGTSIKHKDFGTGVVIQSKVDTYVVRFLEYGISEIKKETEGIEILDLIEPSEDLVSYEEIERSLIRILRKFSDVQEKVELGEKWKGGVMRLMPSNPDLKAKDIPIETFFHKIVMVRDRLRVLEQNINKSKLSDEEKVNIQQYITRSYGSLTTFNVLFKYQSDGFSGVGKAK
ncbi:MAG: hypothetical protein CSA05_02265 [Bacteroidia bacterium]|nr:MAG: hypothetical protein CSA05_02265 [Bacteroidia bacterium]